MSYFRSRRTQSPACDPAQEWWRGPAGSIGHTIQHTRQFSIAPHDRLDIPNSKNMSRSTCIDRNTRTGRRCHCERHNSDPYLYRIPRAIDHEESFSYAARQATNVANTAIKRGVLRGRVHIDESRQAIDPTDARRRCQKQFRFAGRGGSELEVDIHFLR